MQKFFTLIYPSSFEQKIGFSRIRELLLNYCSSTLGKDRVHAIQFSDDFEKVQDRIMVAHEFIRIESEEEGFPFSGVLDLSERLKKIRPEGTWLEEVALGQLRSLLQVVSNLLRFFERNHEKYPRAYDKVANVQAFPDLIAAINRVLNEHNEIKDNASPSLKDIRMSMSRVQSGISRQMDRVLKHARSEGLIDADTAPAMRDGRLVIPVSVGNKRKISGIIHDESATGKTAFIEPSEVVEAHNKLTELQAEERREIIKILTQTTNYIRPHLPEILNSYGFYGWVDVNRAKAIFANRVGAICPKIKNQTSIQWRDAEHPILKLKLAEEGKKVVPLNIELDADTNRILLISGPNAGGKSVCLKTTGLVQYMVQCGVPVPVHEESIFGIFEHIFVDIGDEQSIDNDLSTYSSHLLNMKYFLKNSNNKTLILVDEFGTGTEPAIGGAMAQSVLKHINERNTLGVITTHYSNLKHFATETSGIINGAMTYDVQNLRPLYALQIGKPGSSYAIEIARNIGLPETVINLAKENVGENHINYDKHLREIVRDKKYWADKRDNIRRKDKALTQLIEKLEAENESLSKQKKEVLRSAKTEVEQMYKKANVTIENTIREIRETQAEKEATRKARELLEKEKEQSINQKVNHKTLSKDAARAKQRIRTKTGSTPQEKGLKEKGEIVVGSYVRIPGQRNVGEVMRIKGKEAEVAFGQIKSLIKVNKLEYVTKKEGKQLTPKQTKSNPIVTDAFREKRLAFKGEIDIRGQRAEEAIQTVTNFIDEAYMTGTKQVRILHGTGTGALRQTLRQYLNTMPVVGGFGDEHVERGGTGITIVNLNF